MAVVIKKLYKKYGLQNFLFHAILIQWQYLQVKVHTNIVFIEIVKNRLAQQMFH